MIHKKFNVDGMTCASCQAHVQKAVDNLDGIVSCNVNLLSNSMSIDYDESKTNDNEIIKAVKDAGYFAYQSNNKIKVETKSNDNKLAKLIVSIVLMLILMYISMGHMLGLFIPKFLDGYENSLAFAFTQLLITIPIILIHKNYFINGFKRLFKSPNMDSLIAVGSGASLIYGIFAIYMIGYGLGTNNVTIVNLYRHNLYFESSVMILTLISIGKYLEDLSKKKTTKAVEKLIELAPKEALLLKDDKEMLIPIENINIGDIVIVKKGDKIPVDGEIIEGTGSIKEANMTGESMPVLKTVKDKVFASTILESGYLKIKALKVGEDSSIKNIIKLVEEASNSKAPISKIVDKVSLFFVPIIFLISLVVFIVFLSTGYTFETAFNFAISVLVIACPCSLGLATPVAIMVGSGKGAECGLIIKNAEILENANHIKTIVLDKTGTITEGFPVVTDVVSDDKEELLKIAYSLEQKSKHPLAFAINKYCKDNNVKTKKVLKFDTIEGQGIYCVIDNKNYYGGNINILKNMNIEITKDMKTILDDFSKEGKTPLIFIEENKVLGYIAVKDTIKEGSKEAISILKNMGIKVVMLTGDNKIIANKIASEVGIDEVISDVLPQEKMDIIKKYSSNNKGLVAMVGDGVNDALALTSADLGIAIGGGSDVALDSADIVLVKNNLLDIYNIISLSKRVMKTIKVNLFWAFFYNCIGVVIASGAFYPSFGLNLNPMICSGAMSMSSLFVVLNALTINLFKPKSNKIKTEENKLLVEDIMIELKIEGMICPHCVSRVKEILEKVDGVKSVEVSLENKNAKINAIKDVDKNVLVKAVTDAGYTAKYNEK